mgnify:CR=1 FL=1
MPNATSTHDTARILADSYGSNARVEAARREQQAHKAGKQEEAEEWRRVREVLTLRAGPGNS